MKIRSYYDLQAIRGDLESALANEDLALPLADIDHADRVARMIKPLYSVLDGPQRPWNVWATTLSKVLHRKRPESVVLHDRWIRACYAGETGPVGRNKDRSWSDYMVAITLAMQHDLRTQRDTFALLDKATGGGKLLDRRILAQRRVATTRPTETPRTVDGVTLEADQSIWSADSLLRARERSQLTPVPTHDFERVGEHSAAQTVGLFKGRDRGGFCRHLFALDGVDPWAVLLSVRLPMDLEANPAEMRYLQAAGTADAMVVEIRQPGGGECGAVSVRSVIARSECVRTERRVSISGAFQFAVWADELFDAGEAARIFDAYYRCGFIPSGYTLRPAEGYAADGSTVPLSADCVR